MIQQLMLLMRWDIVKGVRIFKADSEEETPSMWRTNDGTGFILWVLVIPKYTNDSSKTSMIEYL